MTFTIRALSLFFLATLTVRADALVEVRQLLARYPAKTTVRGAVDFQTTSDRKEDGKPVLDQGRTVFRFEASPEGLSLLFPTAELQRAQKEARDERIDPEKKSPTRVALGEVNAAEVENYLDFAPLPLRDLQDASVTDARNVTFQGRLTRQITFRVNRRLSKEESKRVKSIAVVLRVWTDATGNFVGADKSFQMRGSFLFIQFSTTRKDDWLLASAGDRLVVTRHEQKGTTAGLGQKFNTSRLVKVSIAS